MLALLCGGQGLVSRAMFDLVAEAPGAANVLAAAARLLGADPRRLVREAAPEALSDNRQNQILSVTASLALHAAIAPHLPSSCAVTGYSVGEMAAWSIAGVWTVEEALRLTAARAEAMDTAALVPGRLAYVRGLDREDVAELAGRHNCAIAIMNPGRLFVLGGIDTAIESFCRDAVAKGATRAAPLAVWIAAHTPLLQEAVAPFQAKLRASRAADPARGRRLLSGGDGASIFRSAPALPRLAAQVARPINWVATLEALAELGCDRFLDLGPGHALADMSRSTGEGAASYAATEFHHLKGLETWLNALYM